MIAGELVKAIKLTFDANHPIWTLVFRVTLFLYSLVEVYSNPVSKTRLPPNKNKNLKFNDGLFLQVAQATSNQMSKRDPLRPYMDVIDDMLTQMVSIIHSLIKDFDYRTWFFVWI